MTQRIRVLVAHRYPLLRHGLSRLLSGDNDIEVVGEAEDGERAVELARLLVPDLVLMAIDLPKMNGIDATRAIRAATPGVRVLGLSAGARREQLRPLANAGAAGCLSMQDAPDVVRAAIRACAQQCYA